MEVRFQMEGLTIDEIIIVINHVNPKHPINSNFIWWKAAKKLLSNFEIK